MSLPDELLLERFRGFASAASLPLRPITLVYGPNNSGKSALLRALALFGASLEPGLGPGPRLPDAVFPRGRFQDLAWQGIVGSYAWKIGLRWSSQPITEVVYTLNGSSQSPPYIERLDVADSRAANSWRASVNEEQVLQGPDGALLHFDGLMPANGSLEALQAQLKPLRGMVRWLAGVRQPDLQKLASATQEGPPRLSNGIGAVEALAYDADLMNEVARFYASLDSPRLLEWHEAPPLGRWLSLNPASQPLWRVHITDTGEGMAQVLPVLVHASLATREGGVFAVEEPESHLHPSAQRTLARHLCALTLGATSPRFILETHSRVFLLAVQLEVAKGYPAENVRIVWVDQLPSGRSTTTVLKLRDDGQLTDGWPPSALGEDLALARELVRAGRTRDRT